MDAQCQLVQPKKEERSTAAMSASLNTAGEIPFLWKKWQARASCWVAINKLLILQKRALRFIYCSDTHDHAITLFLNARILPLNSTHYKILPENMHDDVRNDLVWSNLDLFIPTAKIHSYNTRVSGFESFYNQKSTIEIKRKSFSRIGAKLWNEIPTKLRDLPCYMYWKMKITTAVSLA